MANEIQANYLTGKTLYAIIRNSISQVWQTTSNTFVTYVSANIANYTIALTEQGAASGFYAGNFPSAAVRGDYTVVVKDKAGGSAAETDVSVAIGTIIWTGTAVPNSILDAINAEIVDALITDTYAEPGQGAPAATASLAAKLNYIYKSWRNKITQNATTLKIYADDGTTVDHKATVSDDGTLYTRGEIATGP